MAGGLIQVASYGSQDLTLTGNPQITYFKIVFRRYTNFGISTVELAFDNPVDFDSVSTITIPNNGDLLTKTTLKIKLPAFDLTNLNNQITSEFDTDKQIADLQKYYIYYDFFLNFINKLSNIVNTFFSQSNNNYKSITYIQDLKNYILKFMSQADYQQFFTIVNFFLYNGVEPQQIDLQNKYTNTFTNASLFSLQSDVLIYIYENYSENDYSWEMFQFLINANMEILTKLNNVIYDKLINTFSSSNIVSMGWIEKIGIFIIKKIEMFIGSNLITSMSSNYIDVYGQLNYKNVEVYNKLIGKDPKINNPVMKNDDKYLYIPIPFWFQNNFGYSIPLIALQFGNIDIKFDFRDFISCVFFDIPNVSSFTNETIREKIIDLIYSKSINIFKSQLEITLLVDYAFLDSIERKKFAQSSHEYLITQVQEIVFTDVSPSVSNFELDFFHCCKSMFWFANQYKYINNIAGKNLYGKYSINPYKPEYTITNKNYINFLNMLYNPHTLFNLDHFIEGLDVINTSPINNINYNSDIYTSTVLNNNYFNYEITPFESSEITLGGQTLVSQSSGYFNYLQPYNYYLNSPNIGINTYSFSLNPTESQPAGSCNLSRIPKTSIKFKIINPDNNLKNVDTNQNYNVVDNLSSNNLNNYQIFIIVENYNILRFLGGIVGIAYTY
jgi:hypothetical protein